MNNLLDHFETLRRRVLAARDAKAGVWTGELSPSALGTALAVAALGDGDASDRRLADSGAAWLAAHANADGGWGDTPASASNLSATLIAAAALRAQRSEVGGQGEGVEGQEPRVASRGSLAGSALERAERWIEGRVGGAATPEVVAKALAGVYGMDRTFAAPILAFLAMCGGEPRAWLSVPPLPFLLALLPQRAYRFVRLQVVSYALPALIAVGLSRHVCAARARGSWAWGRLFAGPLLRRLDRLQPAHGGFLDAIPLTAFVCLSLRHAGHGDHPVVQKGLAFLRQAARPDGSWAIDSNLRTWLTSLAVRAVWGGGVRRGAGSWKLDAGGIDDAEKTAAWLVKAQLKARHPFTGAAPGGWAWTDLPGGVPDADDTSGALVALRVLKDAGCRTDVSSAVRNGVRWLLEMQNADGGMPTFCRGWGRLPFDRSCPDISAHAVAALAAWGGQSQLAPKAIERLLRYLGRAQEADGSWVPLWFGHQEAAGGRNPVVGTARVVDALRAAQGASGVGGRESGVLASCLSRGEAWLVASQHADGGWGMGREATVEETALAVTALTGGEAACEAASSRGCAWLAAQGAVGLGKAAPIGLYFALLWYHERLYPLVWALEALGRNVNEKKEKHVG
jgi:squalene-hopene/tetraprenyl-beta-curcumene cyclase